MAMCALNVEKGMKLKMKETDKKTGKPLDKTYLELDLPEPLRYSLEKMKDTLEKIEKGNIPSDWDCNYCELQSDINAAEVEDMISSEQAAYLRSKYLGL